MQIFLNLFYKSMLPNIEESKHPLDKKMQKFFQNILEDSQIQNEVLLLKQEEKQCYIIAKENKKIVIQYGKNYQEHSDEGLYYTENGVKDAENIEFRRIAIEYYVEQKAKEFFETIKKYENLKKNWSMTCLVPDTDLSYTVSFEGIGIAIRKKGEEKESLFISSNIFSFNGDSHCLKVMKEIKKIVSTPQKVSFIIRNN